MNKYMCWSCHFIKGHICILHNWHRQMKKIHCEVLKFNSISLKINSFHRVPWVCSVRGRRSQRHFYSLNILPGYSTSSEKRNPLGRIRGILSSFRILVNHLQRKSQCKKRKQRGNEGGGTETRQKREEKKKTQKMERKKGLSIPETYFTTPHWVICYFVTSSCYSSQRRDKEQAASK